MRFYRSDLPGYMCRWVLETRWGTLRLHNILRSDDDRALHDHPWDFWSLILWGGYREFLPGLLHSGNGTYAPIGNQRWCGPGSLVKRSAADAHRIALVHGPAWTLVWTGPRVRRWGFYVDGAWVDQRECRALYPEKPWVEDPHL